MIPIGDSPRASQTPWMCYSFILSNVMVWLLLGLPATQQSVSLNDPMVSDYLAAVREATGTNPWSIISEVSAYDLMMFRFGYRPASPSLLALFTSMFLHAGWGHLSVNMLFLYVFGPHVEQRLGVQRFVAVYVGCGMAATLTYALLKSHSPLPLIGASGAISGILGCYYIWFSHHRVRILAVFFIFITTFQVPAGFVLAFYLVVENLLPLILDPNASGGVAYGAHFGGFVCGAFVAATGMPFSSLAGSGGLKALWEQSVMAQHIRAQVYTKARQSAPSTSVFAELLAQGRFDACKEVYAKLSSDQRSTLAVDHVVLFADGLTQLKDFSTALTALQHAIASHPAGPAQILARLHLRAGLIHWRGRGLREPAREHLLRALAWQSSGELARAAVAILSEMDQKPL